MLLAEWEDWEAELGKYFEITSVSTIFSSSQKAKPNLPKMLKRAVMTVMLPLLSGAVFYRFLRQNRPTLFDEGQPLYVTLPQAVQSVPSLLWSFALASALLLIWRPVTTGGKWLVVAVAVFVSAIFEGWQAAGGARGTFDWCDLLFSVAGCGLATVVFAKNPCP
jgi:hypothetical protein